MRVPNKGKDTATKSQKKKSAAAQKLALKKSKLNPRKKV
mgnify:CR=1 FL=1|tara:strand:- start:54 stop:170 length:117 start_codon:yes stop_codon:yes gene_type:complete